MNNQSWTIHAGGAPREVTVDVDPESGRTFVRIDGKMATKPLAADEEERELTIAGEHYVLRRLPGNTFDLDVAPPEFTVGRDGLRTATRQWTAPGTKRVPQAKPKLDVPVGRWIWKAVVIIVIVAIAGWFRETIAYLRVPWKSYAEDRAFRINFAGEPKRDGNKLSSRYRNHWYILEWIDLPGPIHPTVADTALTKALGAIVKSEKATLIQSQSIYIRGKFARSFIAQLPESERWSEGTVRGNLVLTNRRVYIVYAYVPRRESLSFDVGEFLRSLDLPEEPDPFPHG